MQKNEVSDNEFGFMLGRSTMEVVFSLRQLMKKYREEKKLSHDLLY